MQACTSSNAHLALLIAFAAFQLAQMLAEYWLGKTSKTKAGSILELIIIGGVVFFGALLFWRKKPNGP